MSDTETLDDINMETQSCEIDGDFPSISIELLKKINAKVAIFLMIIGIFLFSDIFIEIMPDSYKSGDTPTTHGTILQLTLLVISYLVLDLLIQGNII